MKELAGKCAVITGGANGIGAGSAIALAKLGANVLIGDRDVVAGEQLTVELRQLGPDIEFIECDLMDREAASDLVKACQTRFGGIDILVNNVGGARPRALADQTDRNWERVINLNFMSMIAASQAAAQIMNSNGAIVNVASSEALRAAPGFSIYAACKSGMTSFTKTLALELAHRNIRVNCIAPDMVDTPGLAPMMRHDPEGLAIRDRHVPLARMASIEEVGNAVAFLASPRASWITGVTLPVDGGITAASGWHRGRDGNWQIMD